MRSRGSILTPTRIVRGLVLAALASVLVYAGLAAVSDLPAVSAALRSFPLPVLAVILLLSLACYAARALRWGLLMRAAGYPVSVRDAVYLHWSGQTMSVSPGRVGEVLKPWLARTVTGMPMARGIALVFAERVADLIGVCILSLGGLSLLPAGGAWVLVGGLAAIVAGSVVASSRWFRDPALRVVERQQWAREHAGSAAEIADALGVGLHWRVLWWSVAVSVVAWGFEGVGFHLCLRALGFDGLGPAAAVSVYAAATIVGAFTFLPGGIGLTEASMAGLLVAAGASRADASAATLVTRVATLWWAVGVGWLVLASRPAVLRRLLAGDAAD